MTPKAQSNNIQGIKQNAQHGQLSSTVGLSKQGTMPANRKNHATTEKDRLARECRSWKTQSRSMQVGGPGPLCKIDCMRGTEMQNASSGS